MWSGVSIFSGLSKLRERCVSLSVSKVFKRTNTSIHEPDLNRYQGRVKRVHKGRTRGYEMDPELTTLSYGDTGLRILWPYRVKSSQLDECDKIIINHLGKNGSYWCKVFCSFPATRRALNSRKGGGKGAISHWEARCKANTILYEWKGTYPEISELMLKEFFQVFKPVGIDLASPARLAREARQDNRVWAMSKQMFGFYPLDSPPKQKIHRRWDPKALKSKISFLSKKEIVEHHDHLPYLYPYKKPLINKNLYMLQRGIKFPRW
eukprot:Lithocolla_globosa_v1_NODE_1670_length_2408_cov_13.956226.p1 type:complete len:264 gc:universal NODE_1670_length_2408_cov_13.956226:836-45(-)